MAVTHLESETGSTEGLKSKIAFVRECLQKDELDPLLNVSSGKIPLGERGLVGVDMPRSEVVMTTYFTGKRDPQRNTFVAADAYAYIQPLYDSVRDLGLGCIIFHDGLRESFIEQYTTETIKFVKAELGTLSLNDDRYLLYYEYILRFGQGFSRIILSDVSDVIFRADPFPLIKGHPELLFTGRSHIGVVKHNYVNYQRIRRFEEDANLKIPSNFYNMRIFNAGTIGGSKEVVVCLLHQMISFFLRYNTDRNHNMTIFNYCIYLYWLESVHLPELKMIGPRHALLKAIVLLEDKLNRDLLPDKFLCDNVTYQTPALFAGFPFTSAFKKYEVNSNAYLIHK
ncbi:hypothetical protein FUA23_03980 [Neolewinella aurantiaca]|uniref:Uncharacterized protein n=1 Tax=Neolewinella aurantiaca TaxID=2602767 RepID=A0A5C7FLQ2_9BACT|nr:hypothetical protein [Neolewinella aurantiaca]TXF90969.1 hypothetical protein FUA23_03980 [Neolewinella aurantiaca]